MSSHNILNPANGLPIIIPSKDIVLGLYYLTKGRDKISGHFIKGTGIIFSDSNEVLTVAKDKKCFVM